MPAYRPTPVAAATVTLERRRSVEVKTSSALPTDAATVIMFGRPGLAGRGIPGLFANYSRKGNRAPAPPLAPALSRRYEGSVR